MLTLSERVGAFDTPPDFAEKAVIRPEHSAVARQAAAEGIVLLKNRAGLLPLDPQKLNMIALIGPNARTAQIMGGGSAQVNAHYAVTPYQGITAQLGKEVEVSYALGCVNHKFTPRLDLPWFRQSLGAEHGFHAEYLTTWTCPASRYIPPRSPPLNRCG